MSATPEILNCHAHVTLKYQGAYATGRLEHSGRQNDEKISCKIRNAQSRATFFRQCYKNVTQCHNLLSLQVVCLQDGTSR